MELRRRESVFVIAEIGQNHQGDISVAKEVINEKFPLSLESN
jgi:sialic acid synthase SpsE